MADKDDNKDPKDKSDNSGDGGPQDDPDAKARTLIGEAVAEALDAFATKHFVPRKTDPGNEGNLSVFESLFGKRVK